MAEYLSPGVYIEEVDAGPKPIEGVSTSTAGAAGVTLSGPTSGKPELVTSFADFVRKFGGFIPDPDEALYNKWANNPVDGGRWWQFPLAVRGFFDNGGQRLYVKRVISANATAAAADFGKGLVSEIVADAAADATTLRLRHLIGIGKGTQVRIFTNGDAPVEVGAFTVIKYDSAALSITLERAVGKAIKAGQGFVQIKEIKDPAVVAADKTLVIQAKDRGQSGNDVSVRARPMLGSTMNILQDPATGGNPIRTSVNKTSVTWVVEVDDVTGLANGNSITVKGRVFTVKNLGDAPNTFEVEVAPPDFLSPDEAVGGKQGFKKPDGAVVTTVKTALTAAGDTVELNDVTKLLKDDIIKADGNEYTVVNITKDAAANSGKIVVTPQIPATGIAANTDVKRLNAKILTAGTRRNIGIKDASGLKKNGKFIFVPTGKEHTITADSVDNIFPIGPPIPLGRDWESKKIRLKSVAKVKTTLAAPADTVDLDDISKLKVGDEVFFKTKSVKILARTPGGAAPEGSIKVDQAFAATELPQAGDDVDLGAQVTSTAATWTVTVASAAGLNQGDHIVLNGEDYVISQISGSALTLLSHKDSGDPWPPGTTVRRLRQAQGADKTRINVTNAGLLYKNAIVELDNGEKKETRVVKSVTGDTVELHKALNEQYLETHKLRVIEAQVSARQFVNGQILREENFVNLQLKDNKDLSFLVTNIKTLSTLIEVGSLGAGFPTDDEGLADLANFPIASNGTWAGLKGGDDHIAELSVDDFVGEDKGKGNRTGIQALEDIDEISICLAPCLWSPIVHAGLIQHCEALKDRFAILDPKDDLSIEGIREFREPLDTKYAALYYPWVEVRDPLAKRNVEVAPSGHIAGVYARVDVERGVHKAPANEVIRGITKIAQDVVKREQDLLNPRNINVLRFFPGRGNRVWGARVVTSDSSWKYINVRRLFIFVEESIDEGTQFVVFEPNDEPLWARVRATITNFLTTVWRSGALQGAKPDEAFFVKIDRTTMTQDDIDNGRLICVIGIAPVKPAEFVIFRIQQKTLETKIG